MAMQLNLKELLRLQDTSSRPRPGTVVPCLLCGKPFLMSHYSGEPDQVCPECWATYKDCATVICNRCKVSVGKVPPRVTEEGYYIRPRSVLHIDACNICQPGIETSEVLEILQWALTVGKGRKIIVPGGRK